jgi:hypothetical protein
MAMFNLDDPRTWWWKVPIIAHDVGRSRDRSTAVVGGNCPFNLGRRLLGVKEFIELPVGLYGSALANTLAVVDQAYNRDCLIIADLTNDATYGETLYDTFGRRVIGVQIGAWGDGTTCEQRRVRNGSILVYKVGRTFLLELLRDELREGRVRFADAADSRRTFAQLAALECEQRPSGIIYKCPSGQYDDLAISLALLAWAAQHLDLDYWMRPIFDAHRPRRPRQSISRLAWT